MLARGDTNEGIAAGHALLSYVDLHRLALVRPPLLWIGFNHGGLLRNLENWTLSLNQQIGFLMTRRRRESIVFGYEHQHLQKLLLKNLGLVSIRNLTNTSTFGFALDYSPHSGVSCVGKLVI